MKDGVPEKDADGRVVYEEIELPIDEIDIQNVKKKAVTNLHHRLIDCVINIRPTVDKLKSIGIEPKSSVQYGKGTKGGTTDTPKETNDRAKLRSILEKASRETGRDLTALTREVTTFTGKNGPFKGYDNPESVTTKALPYALERAEKMFGPAPAPAAAPAQGSNAAAPAAGKTTGNGKAPAAAGKSIADENAQPPEDYDPSLHPEPSR
jgi:hypothetical protein